MATTNSAGLYYPLTKMNFLVSVDQVNGVAAFSEVTGVDASVDVIEFRQGNSSSLAPVKIQGLATKTLEVDNIEIINKPDGYTVEPVTQTRSVQIRGTQEAVDAVVATQLRIVADLKDITPATGNQTVPVKVYLDGSSDVGVVGDYNIVISIER